MSVSYRAYALITGSKHKEMYAIYSACKAAGVKLPEEVDDYFRDMLPEPEGVAKNLNKEFQYNEAAGEDQMIIDIAELPKGTSKIMITIS